MKYLNKLSVQIALAVLIGFLYAGATTHISYVCTPNNSSEAGCVSYAKAIMYPKDLLNNTQSSLVKFSASFAIFGLFVFIILSTVAGTQKRKSNR